MSRPRVPGASIFVSIAHRGPRRQRRTRAAGGWLLAVSALTHHLLSIGSA